MGHLSAFGNGIVGREKGSGEFKYCEQALSCDNCHRLTMAFTSDKNFAQLVTGGNSSWPTYWNSSVIEDHYPKWVAGQEFADVPAHISAPASEAHMVFSIGSIRSAVLMSRAVIEATCKDHGIMSGLLGAKVNAMFTAGHINEFTKNVADTIRTFGNDMAHGDFIVDLDSEDAREVLSFMDEFLQQVYQMKARLSRLQDSAAKRKEASKQAP
ncbi:DUF4145 domain-containing protein [Glutamicibacter ardleyensis]|uniref:DUF4145 domain-containing protein n=1 Tax=Glutamicibacter ardleyensis TaxID=225894 RepID=UPI003FD47691